MIAHARVRTLYIYPSILPYKSRVWIIVLIVFKYRNVRGLSSAIVCSRASVALRLSYFCRACVVSALVSDTNRSCCTDSAGFRGCEWSINSANKANITTNTPLYPAYPAFETLVPDVIYTRARLLALRLLLRFVLDGCLACVIRLV